MEQQLKLSASRSPHKLLRELVPFEPPDTDIPKETATTYRGILTTLRSFARFWFAGTEDHRHAPPFLPSPDMPTKLHMRRESYEMEKQLEARHISRQMLMSLRQAIEDGKHPVVAQLKEVKPSPTPRPQRR